jgi:bacteriorhodopsin
MSTPSTALTTNTTAACLAGAAVMQAVAALRSKKPTENAVGLNVNVVAFLHYMWMREKSANVRLDLRYGDWLVTCPLLVYELMLMTGAPTDVVTLTTSMGAAVLMVALGYAAARQENVTVKSLLFCASSALLAWLVHSSLRDAKRHTELVKAFYTLWVMYPVAFLAKNNSMFEILDCLAKGVFGMYVATVSLEE